MKKHLLILVILLQLLVIPVSFLRADSISDNPIVFVTMVPNPRDFGTLAATFGNHSGNPDEAYRGGDLWIRYADGSLKNLTQAAGYGTSGFQGATAIAVRDPAVHWNGTKVIFSMIVGAPTQQYQLTSNRWQLYEISALGKTETPVITKVSNQPSDYNNINPVYASDDSIIFSSDRPRDDSVLHTYPQRDEYESAAVVSGLWKLNPETADLTLLDHAPSGDFNPIIDSFGRVIFTRWDHLQRDQQNIGASLGAFNFGNEASTTPLSSAEEIFPEPRSTADPQYKSTVNLFTINQFFPWMMNQDGTGLETLNHVGRQEIGLYSERSFNDDPNIQEFYGQYSTGANQNEFTIFLHIKESATQAGTYLGTSCQEFGTHAAGQILSIDGAPSVNPDAMTVSYLTHPDTAGASDSPSANHSGLYRDPLPLSNAKIIVSHTSNTRQDSNLGTSTAPASRYDFRLKLLSQNGQYYSASTTLTSGINKSVSFWNPDQLVSYNGPLWEMMPVELKSRTRPTATEQELPAIEKTVLDSLGLTLEQLQNYLKSQKLALVISRNLTMRDRNDRQQPFNLRVSGSTTESLPKSGKIYDISHLEFFQGDLIRGYSNGNSTGRRVIAQRMHSVPDGLNPSLGDTAAQGSVKIAEDGSMAAFVPAQRALSWQISAPDGSPVVKERYWVTFQPGEVRVCASCHGINTADHNGKPPPTNAPLALSQLLSDWKNILVPDPGSGSDSDDYQLSLKYYPKAKAGKRFLIAASGGSASDNLTLQMTIQGKTCSPAKVLTSKSTKRRLEGRLPSIPGAQLKFSLFKKNSNSELTSTTVTLSGKNTTVSDKVIKSECQKLRKSLISLKK